VSCYWSRLFVFVKKKESFDRFLLLPCYMRLFMDIYMWLLMLYDILKEEGKSKEEGKAQEEL